MTAINPLTRKVFNFPSGMCNYSVNEISSFVKAGIVPGGTIITDTYGNSFFAQSIADGKAPKWAVTADNDPHIQFNRDKGSYTDDITVPIYDDDIEGLPPEGDAGNNLALAWEYEKDNPSPHSTLFFNPKQYPEESKKPIHNVGYTYEQASSVTAKAADRITSAIDRNSNLVEKNTSAIDKSSDRIDRALDKSVDRIDRSLEKFAGKAVDAIKSISVNNNAFPNNGTVSPNQYFND